MPELRQEKMWKKVRSKRPRGSFDDEEMCEFLAKKWWFFGNSNDIFGFFHPGTFGGNSMQIDLSIFFRWVVKNPPTIIKRSLKSGNLHH